jgi:hypothetical protein
MNWETKIEWMRTLQKGWNSYKADPPSKEALALAVQMLEIMPEADRVEPSAMGGVGITYRNLRRKAYVETYNTGKCKMAVLLADGIVMNVLKTDDCKEMRGIVKEYIDNSPVLTTKEVNDTLLLHDLDFLVAKHIFDLPELGYYRRKSAYCTEMEKCNKGDKTLDYPHSGMEASVYFKFRDHLRCVPYYTTGVESFQVLSAMLEADHVYTDKFVLSFANQENYGKSDCHEFLTRVFKNVSPEKICRAALLAVSEVDSDELV